MDRRAQNISSSKRQAADGKVYYSYTDIHRSIERLVGAVKEFKPEVIIAIGGGGFIPARIIRTFLKIPIYAVSLSLYDDKTNLAGMLVQKHQWIDKDCIRNKRIVVVDDIDDTRMTLQYCVDELIKVNSPSAVAVFVVHNKLKKKTGKLPDDVWYFSGDNITSDIWVCYPWEAGAPGMLDIIQHEQFARDCTIYSSKNPTRTESGCCRVDSNMCMEKDGNKHLMLDSKEDQDFSQETGKLAVTPYSVVL